VKPACAACGVSELCPSAFKADNVGRKARPKPKLVAKSTPKRTAKPKNAKAVAKKKR